MLELFLVMYKPIDLRIQNMKIMFTISNESFISHLLKINFLKFAFCSYCVGSKVILNLHLPELEIFI